jgi:hypothetical protein
MLFCRLKSSRYSFLYCLLFVGAVHLFFLIVLFIKRGSDTVFLSVSTDRKVAEIVFILDKTAAPLALSMPLLAHTNTPQLMIKPSVQKKENIMVSGSKKGAQKTVKKEVNSQKKIVAKKEVSKESGKKNDLNKKNQAIKKESNKQVDNQKSVVQKKVPDEKVIEKSAEMTPAKTIALNVTPIESVANQLVSGQTLHATKQEIEAYEQAQFLHQKISEIWRPPRGLPAGVACLVAWVVDSQGKAQAITVEKTSGIVMFDLTTKKAVHALEFPIWARGVSFKTTFKS